MVSEQVRAIQIVSAVNSAGESVAQTTPGAAVLIVPATIKVSLDCDVRDIHVSFGVEGTIAATWYEDGPRLLCKPFFSSGVVVYDSTASGPLSAGTHGFPAKLQLPLAQTPPTFDYGNIRISYKLKAIAVWTRPSNIMTKLGQSPSASGTPVRSRSTERSMLILPGDHAQMLANRRCLTFSAAVRVPDEPAPFKYLASLQRNVVMPGDNIVVQLTCQHDDGKIAMVVMSMILRIAIRDAEDRSFVEETRLGERTRTTRWNALETKNLHGIVPATAIPSLQSSDVQVQYEVRIKLFTTLSNHPIVDLRIPIRVIPPTVKTLPNEPVQIPLLPRLQSQIRSSPLPTASAESEVYEVAYPYVPRRPDEVPLDCGDVVVVVHIYDDLWVEIENRAKQMAGVCPLHHLKRVFDNTMAARAWIRIVELEGPPEPAAQPDAEPDAEPVVEPGTASEAAPVSTMNRKSSMQRHFDFLKSNRKSSLPARLKTA
ncbi:uncharacterized protein BJ171DRAFT_537042 [Polychytrium aggregatum]|uniref:uncharacterized protein n=1 Tax=Polychytrium aggregatum TaxID=110093 RepID=UPI0022FDF532|nr:uncharacterized protein BJ171DRAFT_537042 [Polychytrium aggregatum]KAI9192958.1 hypothetical protein BJ171DRAFT_537042 [Polychytrium aggregatum]